MLWDDGWEEVEVEKITKNINLMAELMAVLHILISVKRGTIEHKNLDS